MQIKRRERESDPDKTKKECCVTAKLMVMWKRQTAPRGRAFNPGKTVMGAKLKLYFSLAEGKNN